MVTPALYNIYSVYRSHDHWIIQRCFEMSSLRSIVQDLKLMQT